MKKIKYFFAVLILAAVSSCGAVPETGASRELFAMDTIISIKAYGQRSEEAVNAAAERLTELGETAFSEGNVKNHLESGKWDEPEIGEIEDFLLNRKNVMKDVINKIY